MTLPERVTLVEVGPRDGLQSLSRTYPTRTKIELVELLAETGIPKIEAVSFVRPDVVPQLADAEQVLAGIRRRPGTVYRGLCPNRRGAERAAAAGVDEMLGLITASEAYNRKNSNMSIEDNLVEAGRIAEVAARAGTPLVMAVGVCTFCPYEGEVPEGRVLDMLARMRTYGIEEFYLGISVGVDGPRRIHRLASLILDRWPELPLGLHLHNMNGMALANALAGLQAGVSVLEGSICGFGGGIRMPSGVPKYGNVATEDLAHMLAELDVETSVDLARLIDVAGRVRDLLRLEETSSYASAGGTKAAVLERGRLSPWAP
jgi:hydroxymethylglutaryl-CoA lyase